VNLAISVRHVVRAGLPWRKTGVRGDPLRQRRGCADHNALPERPTSLIRKRDLTLDMADDGARKGSPGVHPHGR